MSKSVTSMSSQSGEKASISLAGLSNIDGAAAFIIKNVNTNLVAKFDHSPAAPAF